MSELQTAPGLQSSASLNSELTELLIKTAQAGENALLEQENRTLSALQEITRSVEGIELLKLAHISNLSAETGHLADPDCILNEIERFDHLVQVLRKTYLEQESLDYYLRNFVLPSTSLNSESELQAEYQESVKEVKLLENEVLPTTRNAISQLRREIQSNSHSVAMKQESLTKLYLDVSQILEDSSNMIEELEKVEKKRMEMEMENRQKLDTSKENAHDPVLETFEEWESIKETSKELHKILTQVDQSKVLKTTMENNISLMKDKSLQKDQKIVEKAKVLEKLIQVWESKFLPQDGESIRNLRVFPQTKRLQFDAYKKFAVTIDIGDASQPVTDIKIFSRHKNKLLLHPMEKANFDGCRDAFDIVERVILELGQIS